MTREEAIEIFKNMLDAWDNYYTIAQSDKKREAVWLAISSLETDEAYQLEYERTTKNDLGVDCIDRVELLKAMDTWDKFGDDPNKGLIPLRTPALQDRYVPYVKYEDMVKAVNGMPSVTPQEPRWIPVSEKLPNDRNWYLGIFKEPDTGWVNPLPFICDYVGKETKATTKEFWILRGYTDRDYKECDYYYNLECVAWMPLPKAYREVEE